VHATLHAKPEVTIRDLVSLATRTLNEFFDPLKGGPLGKGWPMGRAVYRAELLALLNALPGVLYVDGVALETVSDPACCSPRAQTVKTLLAACGNVEICPHGLVAPGQHQITVSIERTV